MTAFIVQVSMGDTPAGSLEYRTIFAVASTLFIITLSINMVSQRMAQKYRDRAS
jgi:phosphate transport system permease protein